MGGLITLARRSKFQTQLQEPTKMLTTQFIKNLAQQRTCGAPGVRMLGVGSEWLCRMGGDGGLTGYSPQER